MTSSNQQWIEGPHDYWAARIGGRLCEIQFRPADGCYHWSVTVREALGAVPPVRRQGTANGLGVAKNAVAVAVARIGVEERQFA